MTEKMRITDQIELETKTKEQKSEIQYNIFRGIHPSVFDGTSSTLSKIESPELFGVVERSLQIKDHHITQLQETAKAEGLSTTELGKKYPNMYRLDDNSIDALSSLLKDAGYVEKIKGREVTDAEIRDYARDEFFIQMVEAKLPRQFNETNFENASDIKFNQMHEEQRVQTISKNYESIQQIDNYLEGYRKEGLLHTDTTIQAYMNPAPAVQEPQPIAVAQTPEVAAPQPVEPAPVAQAPQPVAMAPTPEVAAPQIQTPSEPEAVSFSSKFKNASASLLSSVGGVLNKVKNSVVNGFNDWAADLHRSNQMTANAAKSVKDGVVEGFNNWAADLHKSNQMTANFFKSSSDMIKNSIAQTVNKNSMEAEISIERPNIQMFRDNDKTEQAQTNKSSMNFKP